MSDALAGAPAAVAPAEARAHGRIAELDSLRGFAALAVLGLHTLHRYFFWAWSAVDLFFILSGFLISGILIVNRESPRMLLSFYVRRALRIWPVYYITLLAVVVLHYGFGLLKTGTWLPLPDGQWLSLIFLQYVDRYAGGDLQYLWYFDHSWSLAVEEQFYLLWPLVFFLVRPGRGALLAAGVLLLAGAALARYAGLSFWLLMTRVDGLVFGILLAHLAADRNSWLYQLPLQVVVAIAALALALLFPYLGSHEHANLVGVAPRRALETSAFCLLYATIVGVAVRCAGARWLAWLRLPALTYFGRTSFAIYMYQVPIAYFLLELTGGPLGWREKAAVCVLTLGLAHLSYATIERRVLALKSFFPYRSAPR